MNDEKLIKVHLPGESLWAKVTGKTADGRTKAELRNASVHGIPWGTAVVLGVDDYEIVEPRELVAQAQASVDAVSGFPVLRGHGLPGTEVRARGCPGGVPWDFVKPHAAQAQRNHGQTLERLAERGGLSPAEVVAVVRGEDFPFGRSDLDAVAPLLELLAVHKARKLEAT